MVLARLPSGGLRSGGRGFFIPAHLVSCIRKLITTIAATVATSPQAQPGGGGSRNCTLEMFEQHARDLLGDISRQVAIDGKALDAGAERRRSHVNMLHRLFRIVGLENTAIAAIGTIGWR